MEPELRIEVLCNGTSKPLNETPLLTSAENLWQGFLLEQFVPPRLFEAPEHEHDTHVIHLHTGPAATVEWKRAGRLAHTRTAPGSASIAPQGTHHSVLIEQEEPGDILVLEIEPAHLGRVLEDSKAGWKPELLEQPDTRDRQIELLMLAMREDVRDGSPAGTLYGESLGTALAIYLAQRYGSVAAAMRIYQGGFAPARLKRVLDYIDGNLGENMRLTALAEVAGMSLYHFAKLFKQSTGESPHRYVLRRRVERAKELLRNPQMSVLEASVRTGFVDQRHFAKVFRRAVGATPSNYRSAI